MLHPQAQDLGNGLRMIRYLHDGAAIVPRVRTRILE
jgi:hypothetical protein